MKTKAAFAIFGALLLSSVGGFYYGGAPDHAGASEKTYIMEKETKLPDEINSKERINREENNKDGEAEGENNGQPEVEAAESSIENKTPPKDTIQYGDSLYVNIMNEPKYQRQAKIAHKYGTELYAVSGTDLFAYFKGKEMVIGKSTGVASASPQYVEMLKELYSGEGFLYEGVSENIDFVNKTGAKVSVEFDRYEAYTISKKENGWIELSW